MIDAAMVAVTNCDHSTCRADCEEGVEKMKLDIKVGIKSDDEFFSEAREIARKLDTGWRPELPVEWLYFEDLPTLLKYLTPKRFELLNTLHAMGHVSINALAKKLHRQYRNVFDDVKILERLSLVEKDEKNLFYVPWDEIDATFRLAA